MFDQLRDSMRSLSGRLAPEERRRVASTMREAMVLAKVALNDMRDGVRATERRLTEERASLETVRRRQGLAADIGDTETVQVAERFAAQHAERVAMLETKLMSQQQELTVHERELDDMSAQLKMAIAGVDPGAHGADQAARREVDAVLDDTGSEAFDPDLMDGDVAGMGGPEGSRPTRRTRAEKEADAEDRLAALKRRMGK